MRTEHPAILKVQELYGATGEDGRLRPLAPCEDALAKRVATVLWRTIRSRREATDLFTEGTESYRVALEITRDTERRELDEALRDYEHQLEEA